MFRKLCILGSFVLVLALSGSAQAWKYINDPNYNLSFEYDVNFAQIVCSTPDLNNVKGWNDNEVNWATVEMPCSQSAGGPNCGCKDATWFSSDGICNLTMGQYGITDQNLIVWQSLNPAYDANVIIKAYYEYRVSYDTFKWTTPSFKAYLFYGNIADNNSVNVDVNTIVMNEPSGVPQEATWKTYSIGFVAEAGQPYIGKPLGIRFFQTGSGWYWVDNVRVKFRILTVAHDPNPEDGATEVSKNAILKWTPGLWAKKKGGHDVYFGASFDDVNNATTATATIFKGNQDANSYDPNGAGPMVLGRTYYWRIDEVNQDYNSPPGPVPYPPNGRWKGDVWSFTVYGRAKNPNPADGATDVPKNVILRWTSGVECKYHDVYFGTSESAVEAATTATSGIYKTRINRTTEEFQQWNPSMNLRVNEQYFWRIDEVNTMTVKGYVWDFTVANWILIDDFDFYATSAALNTKWKPVNIDTAYLIVNKDANFAVDGNSMQFEYTNDNKQYIAEAKRTYSPVQDWSYTGSSVTCLELNFFGDANNNDAGGKTVRLLDPPMFVKLSDGTKTAQVNYPDINDCIEEWQHTWNIPLKNFSDKGVTLSKISSIILGMGDGANVGGKEEKGTIYFDDITVWPPRCVLEYGSAADLTEDCTVDNADLDIMATDWLVVDGLVKTETQNGTLTGFTNNPAQWVAGHDGNALEFDGVDDYVRVTDPRLKGITSMSISAWVKQPIINEFTGIVTSREVTCGDDAAEIGISGSGYGGPGASALGYDWPCCSYDAWKFDAGLDVPINTWTFVALTVEPNSATLYMRPVGGSLGSKTDARPHPPLDTFGVYFDIGQSTPNYGFHKGTIDDVRIYDYDLSFADINNLSLGVADPNPWPVYWYKLNEKSGLIAADSGFGTEVYSPVPSKANLTDPEPKLQRSVNLRDYAILADDWLVEKLWPMP